MENSSSKSSKSKKKQNITETTLEGQQTAEQSSMSDIAENQIQNQAASADESYIPSTDLISEATPQNIKSSSSVPQLDRPDLSSKPVAQDQTNTTASNNEIEVTHAADMRMTLPGRERAEPHAPPPSSPTRMRARAHQSHS